MQHTHKHTLTLSLSLSADIVVTDPLGPESNSQTNNAVPIIAGTTNQHTSLSTYLDSIICVSLGAIVAGVLLIALVLLVLVSVTVWGTRRRREKKAEEAGVCVCVVCVWCVCVL